MVEAVDSFRFLGDDALRAQLAYLNSSELETFFNTKSTEASSAEALVQATACDIRVHAVENSRVVSWLEQDRLIFAFPGTVSGFDVLDDLDVVLTTADWLPSAASVHTGFLHHYNKIRSHVAARLKEVANESVSRVHFVGHSLGGAVASLAFYASLEVEASAGPLSFSLATFACPRIGNKAFTSWSSSRVSSAAASVLLVAHALDLIPYQPYFLEPLWFTEALEIHNGYLSALEAHHISTYLKLCRLIRRDEIQDANTRR